MFFVFLTLIGSVFAAPFVPQDGLIAHSDAERDVDFNGLAALPEHSSGIADNSQPREWISKLTPGRFRRQAMFVMNVPDQEDYFEYTPDPPTRNPEHYLYDDPSSNEIKSHTRILSLDLASSDDDDSADGRVNFWLDYTSSEDSESADHEVKAKTLVPELIHTSNASSLNVLPERSLTANKPDTSLIAAADSIKIVEDTMVGGCEYEAGSVAKLKITETPETTPRQMDTTRIPPVATHVSVSWSKDETDSQLLSRLLFGTGSSDDHERKPSSENYIPFAINNMTSSEAAIRDVVNELALKRDVIHNEVRRLEREEIQILTALADHVKQLIDEVVLRKRVDSNEETEDFSLFLAQMHLFHDWITTHRTTLVREINTNFGGEMFRGESRTAGAGMIASLREMQEYGAVISYRKTEDSSMQGSSEETLFATEKEIRSTTESELASFVRKLFTTTEVSPDLVDNDSRTQTSCNKIPLPGKTEVSTTKDELESFIRTIFAPNATFPHPERENDEVHLLREKTISVHVDANADAETSSEEASTDEEMIVPTTETVKSNTEADKISLADSDEDDVLSSYVLSKDEFDVLPGFKGKLYNMHGERLRNI